MNNTFKPTDSPIWDELANHRLLQQDFRLVEKFAEDPARFEKMHVSGANLILDYSKNLVTKETLTLLVKAAESLKLEDKIAAMTRGDKVNTTEDRPALHTALRDFSGKAPFAADIDAAFSKMKSIVEQVHSGQWMGCTGQRITDVVNIGIGGSHLGPMMVTDALKGFSTGAVECHFVSNIDNTDLHSVLDSVAPESTLFIICSKSFTTLESLQNAKTARAWLEAKLPEAKNATGKHFLAVSSKPEKAGEFGIPDTNVLPMWDWVGGRYSLWSAIGISIAMSVGMENFNHLRKGAQAMDTHFQSATLDRNLPVLLALLDIWYVNYWGSQSQAVLPYCHHLRYFPEFLQQLTMESNGKSVDMNNKPISYPTAPVTWGTVETNGQHSFHQLLHQGTGFTPVDFIAELNPSDDEHHAHLLANCLAQSNALMNGKSHEDIKTELIDAGMTEQNAQVQAMHRQIPGNRPSNTIVFEKFTPEILGSLIALYEHRVFVQSVIWNINAFDQFGVELGKKISQQVYTKLVEDGTDVEFDVSTEGLIGLYKKAKN